MRVDVAFDHRDPDAELAALHARMRTPGDALYGMPAFVARVRGLDFRTREADGEFYVYVEDPSRDALAGCTVFQRVAGLDRHIDPYVRSPHSRYGRLYQRRGIATAVYEWALHAGMCLVSGPRQSPGAHRLWIALSRTHEMTYVHASGKRLDVIGPAIDERAFGALETRMLLLGSGWTLPRFAQATRRQAPNRLSQVVLRDAGSPTTLHWHGGARSQSVLPHASPHPLPRKCHEALQPSGFDHQPRRDALHRRRGAGGRAADG